MPQPETCPRIPALQALLQKTMNNSTEMRERAEFIGVCTKLCGELRSKCCKLADPNFHETTAFSSF